MSNNIISLIEDINNIIGEAKKSKLIKVTRKELDKMIKNGDDLTNLDVSGITDMSSLFSSVKKIKGDISEWDVSNVTDMGWIFSNSKITPKISKWDVSNVTDMSNMFENNKFNGDISKWNTSKVIFMDDMFNGTIFNGDISKWNVSNVRNMITMFASSKFNGDISRWDTKNVLDMAGMFLYSKFKGDISKWNISNVDALNNMFDGSVFNGDISNWDVSKVKDFSEMFRYSKFNGDISDWDTSSAVSMYGMFDGSDFNGDISEWDFSNVSKNDSIFTYLVNNNKTLLFNVDYSMLIDYFEGTKKVVIEPSKTSISIYDKSNPSDTVMLDQDEYSIFDFDFKKDVVVDLVKLKKEFKTTKKPKWHIKMRQSISQSKDLYLSEYKDTMTFKDFYIMILNSALIPDGFLEEIKYPKSYSSGEDVYEHYIDLIKDVSPNKVNFYNKNVDANGDIFVNTNLNDKFIKL